MTELQAELTNGLEYLNDGYFSRAYDMGDKVRVISSCLMKQVMARGEFPNHPIFPKVEEVGKGVYDLDKVRVFNHPLDLKYSLKKDQYALYENLKDVSNMSCNYTIELRREKLKFIEDPNVRIAFSKIFNIPYVGAQLDIKLDNVGATSDGRLILFDAFFSGNYMNLFEYNRSMRDTLLEPLRGIEPLPDIEPLRKIVDQVHAQQLFVDTLSGTDYMAPIFAETVGGLAAPQIANWARTPLKATMLNGQVIKV